MEAHSVKLVQNIANMFNDARYSDTTVIIRSKELHVHKAIICTQSKYFENAFKENFVEGSSGRLSFDEGSGAAHWRVFQFLYTGDYSDDLSHYFKDDPALLKEPRVYALADMFFLKDLKTVTTAKLKKKLLNLWKDDSFADCIREIYATTRDSDRAMRSAVVEIAKVHAKELVKKPAFTDLIHNGGDFAVQYFESVVSLVPLQADVSTTKRRQAPDWLDEI
ncbi:hypothetical protein yc1106_08887 [Curvularia clavata]|uniref:BTB domain-containing protein n=1 Tax=Curvularia clavata TaxID=95742 RepID=A0A9Q8ZJ25_CURCL|nr:hypothetical protein yc1106_08887 [Curvularia clavata]